MPFNFRNGEILTGCQESVFSTIFIFHLHTLPEIWVTWKGLWSLCSGFAGKKMKLQYKSIYIGLDATGLFLPIFNRGRNTARTRNSSDSFLTSRSTLISLPISLHCVCLFFYLAFTICSALGYISFGRIGKLFQFIF